MQKKLALALTCFTLMYLPNAFALICPFNDNFMIQAPVPLHIISYNTQGNVSYNQFTPNSFTLSCADGSATSSGSVNFVVGTGDDNQCALTLRDGPYEMNPSITMISCSAKANALHYVGMDHVFGTFNYTLRFMM